MREGSVRVRRPSVVCEYDYISIDACIVQFGRGMATGVTSTTCARSCTGTLHGTLTSFKWVRSILRWQPTPERTLYRTRVAAAAPAPAPPALALPSLIPLPHPSERPTRKLSCCFKASIIQRFLKWIIISVRRRASRGRMRRQMTAMRMMISVRKKAARVSI